MITTMREAETHVIKQALQISNGDMTQAAIILKISKTVLYKKCHQYGFKSDQFKYPVRQMVSE